ncbi:MAG TPA: NUDIX hydrolase [Symbiobacteriaceae bacterium]|nr:NUDIX hydrolase [Symbiobacteriaceae bacterium]
MTDRLQGIRAVARVLIQDEEGNLLLCRSADGKAWVPPGGTIDQGENFATAAVREAMEEVGLPVELGPLAYLQEFRPAHRDEHVIEVAFRARALASHPVEERAVPSGPAEAPWSAWQIEDLDGPRRLVRWFSQAAVQELSDPVYPASLKDQFWKDGAPGYLGLVQGR